MIYMTKSERKEKLSAMKSNVRKFERLGDTVLADQARRSLEDAKSSWVHRPEQGFVILPG
jgi:hypothetical protein